MKGVTPEEIRRAKEMDLLTYLRNFEPQELVHLGGGNYCTRTHDSLKISNGMWMWFSRGVGGRSALDYLIKVKEYSFVEAVNIMNGQEVKTRPPVFSCPKPEEKRLLLPEKSPDNSRMIKYLSGRGIDMEIIRYCIEEGLIYESLPHHNVIFLGFDEKKTARYAAYRATNNLKILGDAAGSDKQYSFQMVRENRKGLHIFESAIDLLSYATLLKYRGEDWRKESLMSLAGVYGKRRDGTAKVPIALQRILSDSETIEALHLHFDNDKAGRIAAGNIRRMLGREYEIKEEPPPAGKDFNDYLCICLRTKGRNMPERSRENERDR